MSILLAVEKLHRAKLKEIRKRSLTFVNTSIVFFFVLSKPGCLCSLGDNEVEVLKEFLNKVSKLSKFSSHERRVTLRK